MSNKIYLYLEILEKNGGIEYRGKLLLETTEEGREEAITKAWIEYRGCEWSDFLEGKKYEDITAEEAWEEHLEESHYLTFLGCDYYWSSETLVNYPYYEEIPEDDFVVLRKYLNVH